jgi:tetratricopeptide (TPR) repeat protein
MQDITAAFDYTKSALFYEPYNQNLQINAMEFLLKLDRIDEARSFFEETSGMMMDEINTPLSQEMIDLYRKIDSKALNDPVDIEPIWEVHTSLHVPFVGRTRSMTAINRALRENNGIVILGESGQGKTRLIKEYIAGLHPQPRVLTCNCRPSENSLPFHPIVDLLRRHVTPEEWAIFPSLWSRQLSRLLPELGQGQNEKEAEQDRDFSDQGLAMIQEGIRQIFSLMNQKRPLFFVIDDVQWADKATLSGILYLLNREPFSNSASIAILARLEEINKPLQEMLNSIQQSKHATVYQLNNLSKKSITNLIFHFLETEPTDQFLEHLMADTGGNTFFVLEILRAIMEQGEKPEDNWNELPVTENLQNLLVSRIKKLNPDERNILEVAAIIGQVFSVSILGMSCQKTNDELTEILRELEYKLLIKPYQHYQGDLYYQFSHDKIQETLLSLIQPSLAQNLHVRVVNALSFQKNPEAGILAHHYHGAGELNFAYKYWILAAKRARSLFSKEDASRNYKNAFAVMRYIESELSSDEIYQFFTDWGDLTYNLNETEELNKIGKSVLEIGKRREAPLLIGTGIHILSQARFTVNDFERGLAQSNQAISYLENAENTFELIEALNHNGVFHYMLNNLDDALQAFQNALILNPENSDPKINKARSHSHYQTALLYILKGKPNRGFENGLKALAFAEVSGHAYSIVQAHAILALAKFYMGQYIDAREFSSTGIQIAKRIQGWRMLGYLHSYAAMAEVALGYLDSAREHAESAIRLGEKYGQYDVAALGYRQLGELHRLIYDYPRAALYHQKGFDAMGENFIGLDNLYRLGLVQYHLGNPDGVKRIDRALAMLETHKIFVGEISAKICKMLICASNNQWPKARRFAFDLMAKTQPGGLAGFYLTAIISLGNTFLAEKKWDESLEQYVFAADEARSRKNPWLELKARSGILQAQRNQNLDSSSTEARIRQLVSKIDIKTQNPDTRPAFSAFKHHILTDTDYHTVTL